MREQADHVIAIRGQIASLDHGDREIVIKMLKIAQVADPLSPVFNRVRIN